MKTRVLQVNNEQGLHARPAAAIAKMVSEFSDQSDKVLIGKSEDNLVDASSVLELLSLKANKAKNLLLPSRKIGKQKVCWPAFKKF